MNINIDLVPTEICNWSCNYCIFPLIKNPKTTTEYIINSHYNYIKKIIRELNSKKIEVNLYLQGGEIGKVPENIIVYLLEKFDLSVTISTNGLFMENDYHNNPSIRKYIKQIFWHVTSDCEISKIKNFVDDKIKIVRGIVHNNRNKMDEFISVNKQQLNIEYSEIEVPLGKKSIVSNDIIEKCRNYHSGITIDLVNENLCLCIRNFKNITIPLSEKNLMHVLKSFPQDTFNLPEIKNSSCYSCCRLCTNRVNDKTIPTKVKLINIMNSRII